MSTYTVQAGDSFYALADRLGVDRGAFAAANPQVSDINVITPGQVLNVPGTAPGGGVLAKSGLNAYAVAGAIGLGVGLLWLLFMPRSNPAPKKRRKGMRKMTPAQYVKLARGAGHAYKVGSSLVR